MRGLHGGHLFASSLWPRHTGCSLEAIDITVHERNHRGAYSRCIPRAKEQLIRRDLLHVASYHHIPELDAMLSMNAKFRGWCNYYKYANSPQVTFNRTANK